MQRYCVKWNNGFWKIFDNQNYTDVKTYALKIDAERDLVRFNSSRKG